MKIIELKNQIANNNTRAYFLCGDEAYWIDYAIKLFSEIVDSDLKEFNLRYIEDMTSLVRIANAVQQLPVFSDKQVVIVKSSIGYKASASEQKELISILQALGSDTSLVFVGGDALKKCHSYGDIVDCNKLSHTEVIRETIKLCSQLGGSIVNVAASTLAEYTADNLMRVKSELRKLVAYADGTVITQAMVEEGVVADVDYEIYELSNAMASKKYDKGLMLVNKLLDRGESPSQLLSTLLGQYRRMLYIKISDMNADELAKYLKVHPYAIKATKSVASNYSAKELKQIVDNIKQLELEFKSGILQEKEALNCAISSLM